MIKLRVFNSIAAFVLLLAGIFGVGSVIPNPAVGNDGVTHADVLLPLGPFLAGIDAYMPAPADPPNGKITFASQQRPTHASQVINTPNWSMDADHFMTVTFRDYAQSINTWGECKRAKPSPCK